MIATPAGGNKPSVRRLQPVFHLRHAGAQRAHAELLRQRAQLALAADLGEVVHQLIEQRGALHALGLLELALEVREQLAAKRGDTVDS